MLGSGSEVARSSGKAAADDQVERSLYLRAVGYTFDRQKILDRSRRRVRSRPRRHMIGVRTAQMVRGRIYLTAEIETPVREAASAQQPSQARQPCPIYCD